MKFLCGLIMVLGSSSLIKSYGDDTWERTLYGGGIGGKGTIRPAALIPESMRIIHNPELSNTEKIKAADQLVIEGNKKEAEKVYRYIMNDGDAAFVDRAVSMQKLRKLNVIV